MRIELSIYDYLVIFSYFFIVFFIHLWWRQKNKSSSESKLENYFLAGRKLTLPLFVGTLVSTWYGNLLGVGEISFRYGLVNWLSQGFFWYVVYIFFAFFLVNKVRESKLYSIPDQFEKSYDKKTAVIGAVINLIMLNPASYILSMGLIFNLIFGIDKTLGIVLGAALPLVYNLKGGFKAVVYSDFVQFVFMYLGAFLLVPFAYAKYGGWDFLADSVPHSHLQITGDWTFQMMLAWFLIALWTLVDPNFYQRTWAAESPQTARRGILISTVFWFIFDMLVTFSGIYAFAIIPDAEPILALPLLADKLLPVFFKGIFFTGLIATVISTLDSLSFASSMSFAYDICFRLNPKLNEDTVIKISRMALIVTLIAGLVIALNCKSLMTLIYYRGTIAVSSLVIPLMAALFLKKPLQAQTAFLSIFAGAFFSILWIIMGCSKLSNWEIFSIEPLFPGLLASGLFVFLSKPSKS